MEASDTTTAPEGGEDTTGVTEAPEQGPVTGFGPHDVPGDQYGLGDGQEGTDRLNGQPSATGYSSAPPPNAQSGVPLDEDRAAGVTPGEQPPVVQEGKVGPEVAATPSSTPAA